MKEPLKQHGDPLEDEVRPEPVRGAEEVDDNQPGSKGRREETQEPIVRSANQKPDPRHPADDATMEPGGDLGQKRNTM
jgi:hypothetical protein